MFICMPNQRFVQKEIAHKICYRVAGTGHPLMLVHGFAEHGQIWENQVSFLSSRYRIIIPDLPGSGISRSIKPTNNTTLEDFAECLLAIADAEALDRFSLLGHSMGGYVTLAFAQAFPERLNGFGLIHSTTWADSEEKKINRTRSIEFILKFGSQRFIETMVLGLYSDTFAQNNPGLIYQHISQATAIDLEVLAAYYTMMKNRPDRRSVLTEFTHPILFIIGTEDKAVLLKDSMEQCNVPVDPHIHILEGVGHMGMIEASEKINKAIDDFMAHVLNYRL